MFFKECSERFLEHWNCMILPNNSLMLLFVMFYCLIWDVHVASQCYCNSFPTGLKGSLQSWGELCSASVPYYEGLVTVNLYNWSHSPSNAWSWKNKCLHVVEWWWTLISEEDMLEFIFFKRLCVYVQIIYAMFMFWPDIGKKKWNYMPMGLLGT